MRKVYKFADIYFDIETTRKTTHLRSVDYVCENPPRIDVSINIGEADIEVERQINLKHGVTEYYPGELEYVAVHRKIAATLSERNAFLMHGALIEYRDKGYLFTANSGTGKTTHIRLWQKVFGEENVTVINGDKPFIRIIDGEIYAYGSPWSGKERMHVNRRVPLAAICFIKQAKENSITEIDSEIAVPLALGQVMIDETIDLGAQLDLLGRVFEKTPFYVLNCNMDDSAAIIAEKVLVKEHK